jgi:opacity protein-like surface antigen
MMMKFRIGMTLALALGAAALASAQRQYDPYRGGQYGGGPYGQPSYGYGGRYDQRGGGPAYQIGFEDGRRDGERDAYTGHSFRPTHSGNFHHADRGYRREFGPKQFYKDTYRSGYTEGYRAGFGQSRGRRW